MKSVAEALHAAAVVLEEDVRKIDAGETTATPAERAFLVGAMRGLRVPTSVETGGFPVDSRELDDHEESLSLQIKGVDGGRPENTVLADESLVESKPRSKLQ